MGLDDTQSHPLRRACIGQYQISLATGVRGDT